ncbi:MAG: type IV secretory system conjugative DNA transfer family protein, partial [Spirochaetes bacterium]|nr:type IV secretory system conjugative DNA transfer family protein [Spirochaetota bacterium]
LVCLDPKGEHAGLTAMRRGPLEMARGSGTAVRRFLGQNVAVLDPLGYVRGPARLYRTGYNPLLDLDPAVPSFVRDVWAVARGMIHVRGSSSAAEMHFSEMAHTILSGVVEAVIKLAPPKHRHLAAVASLALDSGLEGVLKTAEGCQLAGTALSVLQEVGENERGSFYTTLSRELKWLSDPSMRAHVAEGSFSLRRALTEGGWSVYFVLPPEEMQTFSRWLRVLLAMALRAKLEQGVMGKGPQTLFLLDEMPVLGRFDMIEEGAAYLPGYGVKLCAVVQNLSQIKELYRDNWRTFLGNTAVNVFFGINDDETAKYVSERLGQIEVWEESYSESDQTTDPQWRGRRFLNWRKVREHEARGSAGQSKNRSWQKRLRAVMRPEEVVQATAREQQRMVGLPAEGPPLFIARHDFYRRFPAGWYEPEENILAIERWRAKMLIGGT